MFRHRSIHIRNENVTLVDPYTVRAQNLPYGMSKYARNDIIDKHSINTVPLKAIKAKYVLGKKSFFGLGNKNEYVERVAPENKEIDPPETKKGEVEKTEDSRLDRLIESAGAVGSATLSSVYSLITAPATQTELVAQGVLGEDAVQVLRYARNINENARAALYDSVIRPTITATRNYIAENVLPEGWTRNNFIRGILTAFFVQYMTSAIGSGIASSGGRGASIMADFPSSTVNYPTITERDRAEVFPGVSSAAQGLVAGVADMAGERVAQIMQAAGGIVQQQAQRRGGRSPYNLRPNPNRRLM